MTDSRKRNFEQLLYLQMFTICRLASVLCHPTADT